MAERRVRLASDSKLAIPGGEDSTTTACPKGAKGNWGGDACIRTLEVNGRLPAMGRQNGWWSIVGESCQREQKKFQN